MILSLVPGHDLPAAFYAPFCARMREREFDTQAIDLPALAWPGLVAHVCDAIAARRSTTLIAHSLGGLVAWLAAARAPAPLERLVLVEPAIMPSRWLARLFSVHYRQRVVEGDRARFDNDTGLFRRVADLSRYPRAAIEQHLSARKRTDPAYAATLFAALPALYPLPRVALPTLIVTGAETGHRSRWLQRGLRRRLQATRTVTLENAAHWLFNEQDAALAEAIAAFIQPSCSQRLA